MHYSCTFYNSQELDKQEQKNMTNLHCVCERVSSTGIEVLTDLTEKQNTQEMGTRGDDERTK
jgi:hypothetical protein